MTEMDDRIEWDLISIWLIFRKMDLLILENGDAYNEFVLAQLAQFARGFVFAFVFWNKVDEAKF